jgi:indolepyruvate ferredoxin oxidoreductase
MQCSLPLACSVPHLPWRSAYDLPTVCWIAATVAAATRPRLPTLTAGLLMNNPTRRPAPVTLDDKYLAVDGRVLLSGIQAIVRLVLDQHRLDTSRGLNTGIFVSGYPGSPLGGLDIEFGRVRKLIDSDRIVFRAGLNEEIAATSVAGTQLLDFVPGRTRDGITGFWYGKNPGLDRAADAIRHGNIAGTAPLGGAVAWIGDDPACKSSTLPSGSELIASSLKMPLLVPSSVSELLTMGLHSVAMSRMSGLWTGLKIVADIADATATVDLSEIGVGVPVPDADRPIFTATLLGPDALKAEEHLHSIRLPLAMEYSRRVKLNRIVSGPEPARLGIVAGGAAYSTLVSALDRLGLTESDRCDLGIRIIKIGLMWPIDKDEVEMLLSGLEAVLVLEDKVSFLETQLKENLYGLTQRPRIIGKRDVDGRPLLPDYGVLTLDMVCGAILSLLPDHLVTDQLRSRLRQSNDRHVNRRHLSLQATSSLPVRTPYFCSGCPHNRSTQSDDEQLVGVGIGCHVMVTLDKDHRGTLLGLTQMGGEGAQWIGIAPFTNGDHFAQNLGDGTFFHSGSLAVRAAVAAKVTMTYKLLFNSAVAMTGGQTPEGQMLVPELTRWLALEGVTKTVVMTPQPRAYRRVGLDSTAEVRHRDELPVVEEELTHIQGVTVLLYDDACAAEERRLRKRGTLPPIPERVWINSRVCEGCGDCGQRSSCLSVVPVETEFGRKTAIHQGSCNQDFSCLKGNCPSFVVISPKRKRRQKRQATPTNVPPPPVRLHPPTSRTAGEDILIRMFGIGGTGVVTVSQVLQMACHIEGRHVAGLEQIGLAQKGGPVTSDIRISARPIEAALRSSKEAVDVVIAFDALSASTQANLSSLARGHTTVVVNTTPTATASMVRDPSIAYPAEHVIKTLRNGAGSDADVFIPAQRIAEQLFGEHLAANMLLVGAAYQQGCLPLGQETIEEAIRLNGTGVATNLLAFQWGRAAAIDLDGVLRSLDPETVPDPIESDALRLVDSKNTPKNIQKLVTRLVSELIRYQGTRYAETFLADVISASTIEEAATGNDQLPVTEIYAKQLFKLLAYKDEYEVARLHLDSIELDRLSAEFGDAVRTRVLLHPPLLKRLGLHRKISLGLATRPAFVALRAGRRLRGTRFDPFGRSEMRRLERALPDEYKANMTVALTQLSAATIDAITALAEAPDLIRGYEEVKLAGVDRFRERSRELLAELFG